MLDPGALVDGRYAIVKPLGAGGWGEVYEARQTDDGRRVAIKVLKDDLGHEAETLARFEREARAAAALDHRNIVHVSDFRVVPGEPVFMVMELLDGRPLSHLVRLGPLPPARAIAITTQILAALEAAHATGLVHRDVKPPNVMVLPLAGGGDLAKLLDFGIAHLDGARLTATGTVLGTPKFMAPEQALGASVDARTDVYAVGATLYAALTGKTAFEGRAANEVLVAVARGERTTLASLHTDIPPALVAIVDRAMEREPAARFATAKAMREALEALAPRPASTTRAVFAGAGIALGVVALGAGATALYVSRAPPAEPHALPDASPIVVAPPTVSAEDQAPDATAADGADASTADATAPVARVHAKRPSVILRSTGMNISTPLPGALDVVQRLEPQVKACVVSSTCDFTRPVPFTFRIFVDPVEARSTVGPGSTVYCIPASQCIQRVLGAAIYPRPEVRTAIEVDYVFVTAP